MKKILFSALSLTFALAAGSAFANEPTPPKDGAPHEKMGGHMFKEVDTNNDGSISQDEWKAKGEKMFGEIDANHDGKITPDEMKAHHDLKHAEWEKRKAEGAEKLEERKGKLEERLDKMKERLDKKGEKPATDTTKH